MTTTIDGSRLTNKALDILLADLQKHGNVVSEMHQDALYELLETLSGYASGDVNGRRAFGLPTGTGKTSAIVAFVTACHELDYEVPISISASRTEALCRLKRDLLAKGVPPEWVGLKHATAGASEESSDKPHLVQLVTHSRVRGGKEKDFELFGMYREQARKVCIYDESLLRGNGGSVNYQLTYEALGALMHTDAFKKSADVQLAARFIGDCCDVANAAITQLDKTGDSEGFGVLVQFPKKADVEVDGFKVSIAAAIRGENEEHLQALLRICQDDSLRILMTGQGTGIIWSTEAVPAELDRICILDASHSIRTLISLDKTITSACSFHDLPLKTFEAVEVVQIVGGGGNTTLTDRFRKDRHATAQEFVAVIRENWQTSHGILVFTYLPKRIDMRKAIESELTKAELDATVEVMRDGVTTLEKKLQWRTWGSHEGENSLEFCNVVLAVGVMQRGFLDIASAAQAQTLDSRFPTPHSLTRLSKSWWSRKQQAPCIRPPHEGPVGG